MLGGLTDTLGKSLDPKRTQEALKNTREAKLCLERDRKFMRLSLVQTDESCEESRTTERETQDGIMILKSNLAVGGDLSCHQDILGGNWEMHM